jgi:hypothetical protein
VVHLGARIGRQAPNKPVIASMAGRLTQFSSASGRVNLPLYVFLVAMINDGGLAWIGDCF